MSRRTFIVSIEVEVYDEEALAKAAIEHAVCDGLDREDAELCAMGGVEGPIDVGYCLIMLLDRGEFLDGAQIAGSSTRELED